MKYKVGMIGGSYNPLHLGHLNTIISSANQCEELYIVLSVTQQKDEIDYHERYMWLKTLTQDLENVKVIINFDNSKNKEVYNWEQGRDDIINQINKPIDVVFAGSDYKEKNIWEKLYPNSKIVYYERDEVNISSTEIRTNPYKYYDYLPKIVQNCYLKKVCIIGTESCGKTTLVRNLAKYFNTSYVEEAGRLICDEAGGIDNMQKKHYFEILFKQKELEKQSITTARKVLIIDTDSLITLYYYQLGFSNQDKEFKNIAESISYLNNYDLYLFLEPDVEWIQDGTRTYGDDLVRQENNIKLKQLLKENNIKYETITGDYQDRYTKSKTLIKKLIGE